MEAEPAQARTPEQMELSAAAVARSDCGEGKKKSIQDQEGTHSITSEE